MNDPLPPLTERDQQRYRRQMMMVGFGETEQRRLKASSALIARGGGVGGTVALYLAAAGIGRLTIMHAGNLTWSNLNRQILMNQEGVGQPRAEQISESIRRLNHDIDLTVVTENPNEQNLDRWVARCDILCDCVPTFEERYALNRASVRQRKPMIEAAMNGMEGCLTVFVPGETPCLQCLYPEISRDWSGSNFPVLGAVAGTIACLAAIEAIKVLTGFGQPLTGRLLSIDTERHAYRTFTLRRDPHCPVCGEV
jgi:molybdopterin/thiamine biosynthesis adenylyltransferase